jgi:hypothetical protein
MTTDDPPRGRLGQIFDHRVRAAAAAVLLAALLTAVPVATAVGGAGGAAGAEMQSPATGATNPCVGTITEQPSATTLLSIQGARGGEKTDALLLGVAPNGSVVGVHNDTDAGRWWLYDVDPMPNGDLLVATTEPGITVVERVDPATGEHESVRRLENVEDGHDVDALGDGEYVTVDKGDGRNRVVVYNESREEMVWEWRFEQHTDRFPHDGGGPHEKDWTHVNDVDEIREGVFMVSVRNFDQVVAIERESKEILWTLGEDDNYDVLNEQHNPDYIEGENGTATVLVADSINDRVVEYARIDGEWEQTWVLEGGGLNEPRDADRLPNGNTLVTDRRGHRVLEVTPRGKVVWEFYTPWQPYDAERVGTGPGSEGPSMRELRADGTYQMRGSADYDTARIETCYDYLTGWDNGSRLVPEDELWGPTGASEPGDVNGTDSSGDDADDPILTTVPQNDRTAIGASSAFLTASVVAIVAALLAAVAFRRRDGSL